MSTMNTNMQKDRAPSGAFLHAMELIFRPINCPVCGRYLGRVEMHSEVIHSVNCHYCQLTVVYDAFATKAVKPIEDIYSSSGRRTR